MFVRVCLSTRVMGARRIFSRAGANPEASQWLKAYQSGVYLWNINTRPDVLHVFHSVEKILAVFLCQTLCNSVHG